MRIFLAILLSVLITSTANAKWRYKPVNCSTPQEIYQTLLDPYDMTPMFAAVSNAMNSEMQYMKVPIVLYLNIEEKRFLVLEFGHTEGACILAFGNGLDFDITDDMVRGLLLK